jgi:uncharacterized repeat protein (TIGR03803 family)
MRPTSPHTITVVYSFSSAGGLPGAGLLLGQDGNYYGTTEAGPNRGTGGAIFRMTPAGTVTFLYDFPSSISPDSALIQVPNGNFYGTTSINSLGTKGVLFQMTPQFAVTILHTFTGGTDGETPGGVVLGPNGNLYGTTTYGGTADQGTVYEIATDGTSYTILHNFGDGSVTNDGQEPFGPLALGADNNLYGTTQVGGSAGKGTVYRISP